MQKPIDIYTFMPYTCVYIYTHIHVSCFWSKFVYLHSPAKVAVFSTWQSTYTHSLLTEIKSMLYLVSSSSFRGSVSKMFFNPLFFHGLFSNPPSPPNFFFQHLQGASMLLVLFRSGEYFQRKSCDCPHLCCFILQCQLSWVASSKIIFLDKKTVLQPQRAPTAEGTLGALHSFFTVQFLHRSSLIAVN